MVLMDNLSFMNQEDVATTHAITTDFKILPNPSRGVFRLEYADQPDFIVVRNLHGQEVARLQANTERTQLDLTDLPDGYYSVSLIYTDHILTSLVGKVGE